jgi:hypothetical protein
MINDTLKSLTSTGKLSPLKSSAHRRDVPLPCPASRCTPGRGDRSAAGVRDRTDRTPRTAGSVPQWSSRGSSGHQRSSMVRRNRGSPAFQLAQQGRCVRAIRIVVRRSSNVLNSRVNALGSSTVKVAAPAAAIHLGPELALQLHQAPDLGAVGADVGLHVGGQLADGGQVDAE